MRQYLELLQKIIDEGQPRNDRTDTGTLSIFGYQMRFDLDQGFPLVTTKQTSFRLIAHELLWFLSGSTNIKYLNDNDVHIWDNWADENGDLGPIYGAQWRDWKTSDGKHIDQISELITNIKTNPSSRRLIVSAWNVADLPVESDSSKENVSAGRMALAPCHTFFQFYVANEKLSCQLFQRSADCFIGLPFNIASYALLTHMVAQQCNLNVGELIWTGGDTHIYSNHTKQVNTQLQRKPYRLPKLNILSKPASIFNYSYNDFKIKGYKSHPHIKATIAI